VGDVLFLDTLWQRLPAVYSKRHSGARYNPAGFTAEVLNLCKNSNLVPKGIKKGGVG